LSQDDEVFESLPVRKKDKEDNSDCDAVAKEPSPPCEITEDRQSASEPSVSLTERFAEHKGGEVAAESVGNEAATVGAVVDTTPLSGAAAESNVMLLEALWLSLSARSQVNIVWKS
jgi:hypothetical protein